MTSLKALGLGLAVATATTFTFAKPVAYQIDPTHTATVFSWSHFGFSTPSANFSDIQGTINVDNAKPSNSSVNVTIPLSSLNTNVKALDEHYDKNGATFTTETQTHAADRTHCQRHSKIAPFYLTNGKVKLTPLISY